VRNCIACNKGVDVQHKNIGAGVDEQNPTKHKKQPRYLTFYRQTRGTKTKKPRYFAFSRYTCAGNLVGGGGMGHDGARDYDLDSIGDGKMRIADSRKMQSEF
jgi:hypothetical protein